MDERSREFWEEEAEDTKKDVRRAMVRLVVIFCCLLIGLAFVMWRSNAAIEYASSRIQGQADTRFRVNGTVRSATTGHAVAWPVLHDELDGKVYFQGSGRSDGTFEYTTVAAVHELRVSAFGYRSTVVRVGRPWFTWLPSGTEKVDVRLSPE